MGKDLPRRADALPVLTLEHLLQDLVERGFVRSQVEWRIESWPAWEQLGRGEVEAARRYHRRCLELMAAGLSPDEAETRARADGLPKRKGRRALSAARHAVVCAASFFEPEELTDPAVRILVFRIAKYKAGAAAFKGIRAGPARYVKDQLKGINPALLARYHEGSWITHSAEEVMADFAAFINQHPLEETDEVDCVVSEYHQRIQLEAAWHEVERKAAALGSTVVAQRRAVARGGGKSK